MLYSGVVGPNDQVEKLLLTPDETDNLFGGYFLFPHEPNTAPGNSFIALTGGDTTGMNMWSIMNTYLHTSKKVGLIPFRFSFLFFSFSHVFILFSIFYVTDV